MSPLPVRGCCNTHSGKVWTCLPYLSTCKHVCPTCPRLDMSALPVHGCAHGRSPNVILLTAYSLQGRLGCGQLLHQLHNQQGHQLPHFSPFHFTSSPTAQPTRASVTSLQSISFHSSWDSPHFIPFIFTLVQFQLTSFRFTSIYFSSSHFISFPFTFSSVQIK